MPLSARYSARASHDPSGAGLVQPVLRSVMRSAQPCPQQRRQAQDLAWRWVGSKWPRLLSGVPDRDAPEVHVVNATAELHAGSPDQGLSWSLAVAYRDRDTGRTWMTRADVAPAGTAAGAVNVFSLVTACTPLEQPPRVLAPPGVLQLWVDRLGLDDGGYAVLGDARDVDDHEQLQAFLAHVLSAQRRLPILALCHQPRSRYYGVDPKALATAVRGVAHVACLTTATSDAVAAQWGLELAPVAGAARLYLPGFVANAAKERPSAEHAPLWRDVSPQGAPRRNDPGAFRRQLVQQLCTLSLALHQPLLQEVGAAESAQELFRQ